MPCTRSTSATTSVTCPYSDVWGSAGVGAAVFSWYAMPDYVPSRPARAVIKSALGVGMLAFAMRPCATSLHDLVLGRAGAGEATESGAAGGCCADRPVTAAGAREFGEDAARVGVDPAGRDTLGTLRDRETFVNGGECGCSGGGRRGGGCCKDEAEKASPREERRCCAGTSSASAGSDGERCAGTAEQEEGCPVPGIDELHSGLVDLLRGRRDGRFLATVGGICAGAIALSAAGESAIYRFGEWMGARGVTRPHAKQALVLGALSAAAVYAEARTRPGAR